MSRSGATDSPTDPVPRVPQAPPVAPVPEPRPTPPSRQASSVPDAPLTPLTPRPPAAMEERLARADRRQALLDAAATLVVAGGAEAVSMESVAARAGVSRPLVYKHFANRSALLAAVYQQEAAHLDAELAAQVGAASSVEGMFRALIHGSLHAGAERGPVFAALRASGAWNPALRDEQHRRDRRTVRFFAAQAVSELNVEAADARATMIILLSAIESVMAQWRGRPTRENAAFLEQAYMDVVIGGLDQLSRRATR